MTTLRIEKTSPMTAGPRRGAIQPGTVKAMVTRMQQWRARRRSRLALARLDDHLLDDIGCNRGSALAEAEKHFWTE